MFLTIIGFIVVLGILVLVHELGHFLVARRFGVRAEEFGIGFPPRAVGFVKVDGKWKKIKRGEDPTKYENTVYSLNWLPLGGFVNIKGENGENASDSDSFGSKKIWQRICIVSAGVAMNILLAAILFSVGFSIGIPQVLDDAGKGAIISNKEIKIASILSESPAESSGLKAGDAIISADNKQFENSDILSEYISSKKNQEIIFRLERDDQNLNLAVTPEIIEKVGDKAVIGVGLADIATIRYPVHLAFYRGFEITAKFTKLIIVSFYEIITDLIVGKKVDVEIAGPVGIAIITGQVIKLGFAHILQFMAILSLNLAVLNFAPFPALDGGRVIFLLIEKIRGRAMATKAENVIHNTGFAFLMLLVLLVTFKDITRFSDGLWGIWDKIKGIF